MNSKKSVYLIMLLILIILDIFLSNEISRYLNIEHTIIKSLSGMTPNLKGPIVIFILLCFLEMLIIFKIYENITNKKNSNNSKVND